MKPSITATEVSKRLSRPYQFGERVDLRHHQIHGPLLVEDKSICGFDMSGCIFNDVVSFSGSVFHGLSWFKDAEFRQRVNFSAARFSNDARFDKSCFKQDANFSHAEFRGVGCFDDVVAQQKVTMDDITAYGNLSCARCIFHNNLVIGSATLMGGLWKPDCASHQFQNLDSCTILGRIEN